MNEIRKEHHQNRLNGKQFKISKKKNQQSNQRNQRNNEQHKQKYKKKEKGKQNEKKNKIKNNNKKIKNNNTTNNTKPKGNMNNNMGQSLTGRKSYENDSKKIDDEINQLQGTQYNYLNNGFNNNNGSKIYTYQNPTFYGYKPKHGNHLNRSRMLSKSGSFVPGHMANDVNDFARSIPLPYDHGGDNINGNDWNGRNDGDRQNYQNGNFMMIIIKRLIIRDININQMVIINMEEIMKI